MCDIAGSGTTRLATCRAVGRRRHTITGRLLCLPVLRAAAGGGAAALDKLLCSGGAAGRHPHLYGVPANPAQQVKRRWVHWVEVGLEG